MTDKETTAQMLRRLADETPCLTLNLRSELNIEPTGDCIGYRQAYRSLADRIEDEQRKLEERTLIGYSALPYLRCQAEQHGKPFRDGETIAEWLDRWYLPRPVLDGKPLRGGEMLQGTGRENHRYMVQGFTESETCFSIAATDLDDDDAFVTVSSFSVKRPEVLDADGVPIRVGDTVWYSNKRGVQSVVVKTIGEGKRVWFENGCWLPPELLTHREPDTIAKLRDDIEMYLGDQVTPGNHGEYALREFADRLSAIMERDT